MRDKTAIENSAKKTLKNQSYNIACQESELEAQFKELFVETQNSGRKITNCWFACHARYIYE